MSLWASGPLAHADDDPPGAGRQIRMDHAQRIVVDHFEARVRVGQDRLPVAALDVRSLCYDAATDAVTIHCRDGVRCAERESFKEAITRRSSRYAIQVPADDPGGVGLLRQFRRLLTGLPADTVQATDVTLVTGPRMITP